MKLKVIGPLIHIGYWLLTMEMMVLFVHWTLCKSMGQVQLLALFSSLVAGLSLCDSDSHFACRPLALQGDDVLPAVWHFACIRQMFITHT